VNQAEVAEVVGHLVDEVRLAAAIRGGVREIFLPERTQLLGCELGEHRRVARLEVAALPALQLLHQARNVRQLRGAFHARVRGEDLLDEGRPGAW
jgi:hypothetical protein